MRIVNLALIGMLIAVLCGAALWLGLGCETPVNTKTGTSITTSSTTLPKITTSTTQRAIISPSSTTSTTFYTHTISEPVRIVIPAIKLDAEIVDVGVAEDGSMEVPNSKYAGWFSVGPAPGASGPAVIAGHVSSHGKHGVFYDIKDLEPGDEIIVYGRDGDSALFIVQEVEMTLKTELPTEKIWNSTYQSVLRLITCGGEFDKDIGHYLSNVIVYANLENWNTIGDA